MRHGDGSLYARYDSWVQPMKARDIYKLSSNDQGLIIVLYSLDNPVA
jgi:hypothetical protein